MDAEIKRRVVRAQELLREIHHIPVATVNDDGSAHNSPVFLAFNQRLTAFWSSHPETMHSRNIARDPRVMLAVFDSREGHGGLFIRAFAQVIEDRAEAVVALKLLSKLKERLYGKMGKVDDYLAPGGPRLYKATVAQCYINMGQRDDKGVIIRDSRYEVSVEDIVQGLGG